MAKTSEGRVGKRVRITGGVGEFVGKTGVIEWFDRSSSTYRVCLDEPVFVSGVGMVRARFLAGKYLRNVR